VTAVWSGEGCNSGDVCQWFNSMRASATNWPRSALTPTSQNVGHAEFVHSGAGDMVFAYTVQTSSTAPRALYARFRNPGAGSWAGARLLSSGPVPNSPYVALSANGRSTILWSEWPVGGTNVVKGASRPRGTGEWVTQLHLPSQNGASFLAAGEDGSMLGIWEGTGAYAQQNVAAFQAADGTWGQAQPLPLKDLGWFTGGLIAADRAVLTADRSLPDEQRELVVTSFSAGAPAFGNVEVPASLSAGSQGTFSAVVSTWLSPSVTWDFGDGAKASGAAVSHAYASPGTYTVTITGSDGAGGTVSATRTVTVTKVAVVAPQLRKFKVKRHKIARVGSKSARAKRTRVIVKLSQKAEVRFVVKRVRKSGKARKVGAFTKRLDRGKSRFWLKAKAGKRVLKPGRYVVVARAKNGNGRSAAKRQKLIVVR
jgi:chitodextrinase